MPSILRRVALAALVAAPALGAAARPAAAQTVSAAYAPGCGPGACSTVRFGITNTTGAQLLLNTFGLATGSATFAFAPTVPGGSTGSYQALDSVSPFGGTTVLTAGGRDLFIDFLGENAFAFELGAGGSGFVDVALEGAPALTPDAFTFRAARGDGTSVGGPVRVAAVVPEPRTVALLGAGLLAVAGVAVRRRRAA